MVTIQWGIITKTVIVAKGLGSFSNYIHNNTMLDTTGGVSRPIEKWVTVRQPSLGTLTQGRTDLDSSSNACLPRKLIQ